MTTPVDDALRMAYYGTAQAPQVARALQAGPLTAELVDGGLCNIRYDGIEVVRAIAYLVRDENWGTYAPAISNLEIHEDERGFRVGYLANFQGPDGQRLDVDVSIEADATGALQFRAEYRALSDFLTCRNGFCVLHPIALVAGRDVTVEHTDGSIEQAVFPALIDPWQPFKDIRALTHALDERLLVTCRFEGDTFEMEDQRNWSDASYKTYVRPLALPWPYRIAAGEGGDQEIALRITGQRARAATRATPAEAPVTLSLAPSATPLPDIGLLVTPEECAATLACIADLHALAPQRLSYHFDPAAGHGTRTLQAYAALAARYPCRITLECVLPGVGDPMRELAIIAAQTDAAGFRPDDIAVSPGVDRLSVPPGSAWPPCPPLDEVYRAARQAFPGLHIGGGTFSYFTELNRKRPPLPELDWVTHATNPIVHAADDQSVMQTLEALPYITRSCRAIIGARGYRIGPVTLAMRQNPYGSHTVENPHARRVPMASSDPRSRALFGAAWLLGYAAQVAPAGIDVLTFGPLTGPRGLVGTGPGVHYPAYRIVAGLAALAGQALVACHSSAPDRVLALGARDRHGRSSLWVANLSGRAQRLHVVGTDGGAQPALYDVAPYACLRLPEPE